MIKKLIKSILFYYRRASLLQDWVCELDLVTQSSLVSVLRGTDLDNGNCKESKNITRMLRYIIVVDAKKKKSYTSDYVVHQSKVVGFLVKSFPNNSHWVEHILGVAFHIRKHHPDRYVCEYWGSVFNTCNGRINSWKIKERKRIEHEAYVDRVYKKYIDIYTNRYV